MILKQLKLFQTQEITYPRIYIYFIQVIGKTLKYQRSIHNRFAIRLRKIRIYCYRTYISVIYKIIFIFLFMKGTSQYSRPTTAKKLLPSPKVFKQSPKLKTQTQNLDYNQLCDLINQTVLKQKDCEAKGKYVEAQGFKRKAKEIKQQMQDIEMEDHRAKHEKELRELQEAHLAEMNLFHLEWQKQIEEFNLEIDRMLEDLRVKHEKQVKDIEDQIETERKFHQSPKLLELRKVEQELAKQENYMDAHRVQTKANKLEKEELEKHQRGSNNKTKQSLLTLRNKQESEAQALKMRIQLQVQERERDRMREQGKLRQKYQNILKETQFQQNQQLINLNKRVKLSQLQKKSKVGAFSRSHEI